jgi:peptidoglycan hydrolase CwlO-like protein
MRFLMPRQRYTTAWRGFSSIDTESTKALTFASFTLKKEHSTMSTSSRWAYHSTLWAFAFALTAATSACMTKEACDKKVAELDHAAGNREKDLKAQIDRLQKQASETAEQISALTAERDELHKKVEDTTALAVAAVPNDAARAKSLRRHQPAATSGSSSAYPPRLAPPRRP